MAVTLVIDDRRGIKPRSLRLLGYIWSINTQTAINRRRIQELSVVTPVNYHWSLRGLDAQQ